MYHVNLYRWPGLMPLHRLAQNRHALPGRLRAKFAPAPAAAPAPSPTTE
jgi:hypothetical protein